MPLNINFPSMFKNRGDRDKESSKDKEHSAASAGSAASSSNHSNSGSAGDIKIGTPTNFKHNIQVKHDKERNEFIGLPSDWRVLLESNNIRFEANQQAAIEAINLYNKTVKGKRKICQVAFLSLYGDSDFILFGAILAIFVVVAEKPLKFIKKISESEERIDLSGDELDSQSDGEPSFVLQSSPVPKFLAPKHHDQYKSNNTTLNSSTSNLSTSDSSSNAGGGTVSDSQFVPLAYQNEPSSAVRSPSYGGDKGSQPPPEQVSFRIPLSMIMILGRATIKLANTCLSF